MAIHWPAGDCTAIAERRKLHDDLLDQGEQVCPNRVARLARLAGIKAQIGYKRRPGNYGGKPSMVVDNTLDRQFDVEAPDKAWVTDIIEADANKQNSTPKEEWNASTIDLTDAPRAAREYLDTLDEAAFGAASEVQPRFTSHSDPASQWTAARKGPAFFSYSDNYLIDTDHGVIVDVEVTRSIRQAEVGSTKTMLKRVRERFGLHPERLIADTAYGTGPMLGWLVDRKIAPHIPVFDKSGRDDGTWTRADFEWDAGNDQYICPAPGLLPGMRAPLGKPTTAPQQPDISRKGSAPKPSLAAPPRLTYIAPMLDASDTNRPALPPEIARRRTFAIISHPDAGKTTLTEKFLLYGGAIQMAGQVRAKGEARRTRSDFMKMEQDRGISVSASAMSFDFGPYRFNLVDTPGHSDFSEDTYRTLTAVDAAVMVIDGAKGVESQTRKLFEVCRMRDLPILTFCNKMDREARDTFEIIDEIQEMLAIHVTPASWPIGMGRDFLGCYDMLGDRLELMDRADRNKVAESIKMEGLDDPKLEEHLPAHLLEQLREEVEMARELLPAIDAEEVAAGMMTPIWFGSAINSFGVKELMHGIANYGPEPQPQNAEPRQIMPEETKVSGFVFKVQANMDAKHRDRVAFVRMASGHFKRGMKLTHVRSKKPMAISNPVMFLASDRELAEEAWAGDIIGIPNHGQLRIGDTLTEGEALRVTGIPSFAPELLQGVRAGDPMKAKHLEKALMQFAEEGAAKVFKPDIGAGFIVGVVGALQFEVLASRIELEYGLPVRFEASQFTSARWVSGPKAELEKFLGANKQHIAHDHDGDPVYLTRLQWDIDRAERDYPELTLSATKEMHGE